MPYPGEGRDSAGGASRRRSRAFLLGYIAEWIDLTLERVRRHYRAEASPLGEVFALYADFFALFEDFRGYVDFWLFQDLVTDDCSAVRFFLPFDDFKPPASPQHLDSYREFRRLSIEFVDARNHRIHHLRVGAS